MVIPYEPRVLPCPLGNPRVLFDFARTKYSVAFSAFGRKRWESDMAIGAERL